VPRLCACPEVTIYNDALVLMSLRALRSVSYCLRPKFRLSPALNHADGPGESPDTRMTGSSSTSTVAGVSGSTRNNCSVRPSRSTARKREQPDGSPPRHLCSRNGKRGRPLALRCHGVANADTASSTGYARYTATNPGTASYAPTPSITAARLRTPTLCRIKRRCGRSSSLTSGSRIRGARSDRPCARGDV